jgi:hypothetical protein
VLFYADDMNPFHPVRDFQDCLKIQSDLNRLVDWCRVNLMELMSSHPVEFPYILRSIILEPIDSITDLGGCDGQQDVII